MPEEKKGHAKITIDVEINEGLMEVVKEAIAKMPETMRTSRKEK